jgi:hypothetical protein
MTLSPHPPFPYDDSLPPERTAPNDARPGAEGPNVRRLSSEASGPADPSEVARGGVSSTPAAGNGANTHDELASEVDRLRQEVTRLNGLRAALQEKLAAAPELADEWKRVHHLRERMEQLFTKGLEFGLDLDALKTETIALATLIADSDGRLAKLFDKYALSGARNSVDVQHRLTAIETRLALALRADPGVGHPSDAPSLEVPRLSEPELERIIEGLRRHPESPLIAKLVERVGCLEAILGLGAAYSRAAERDAAEEGGSQK